MGSAAAAWGLVVFGLILLVATLDRRQAGPAAYAIVVMFKAGILGLVNVYRSPFRKPSKRLLRNAEERWQRLLTRWQQEATRAPFDAKLAELAALRDELEAIARDHRRALEELRERARERFRADRLRGFAIGAARLPGLGKGRRARLASCGITTAADLDPVRLARVRGLPRALRNELLAWRRRLEQTLRAPFDPPLDPGAVQALEQRFAARRQDIEARLRAGPAELEACRRAIEQARVQLLGELEQAWDEWNRLRYLRDGPS